MFSDISLRDGCNDIAPTERCEELKDQGRCEQWKFMQEKCMSTCGFCKYFKRILSSTLIFNKSLRRYFSFQYSPSTLLGGDNADDEDNSTESPSTDAPATTTEDTNGTVYARYFILV